MNVSLIKDNKDRTSVFWRRKLVGNGGSYQVNVPSEFIIYSGWKEGDILRIGTKDGKLLISKEENSIV